MHNETQTLDSLTAAGEIVRSTIDIATPPERVFDALTSATELAAWWTGDDARVEHCESDPREGGVWRITTIDRDGERHSVHGDYLVVDRPHCLELTWQSDDDAIPSIVHYDLDAIDLDGARGTRLTVTHTADVALRVDACARYLTSMPRWRAMPPSAAVRQVAWARRHVLFT
jgi:uncharacterized protein YndB with AHSA1/START domain